MDAEIIKEKLQALNEPPRDVRAYGDPFMLHSYYPERSEAELSKLFGIGFARSVFERVPQQWHGPVLAGYGTHVVYVFSTSSTITPVMLAIWRVLVGIAVVRCSAGGGSAIL
jgi:hypothetical protein